MIILSDALLPSAVCKQAFGADYDELVYVHYEWRCKTPVLRGWLQDESELIVILDDVNLHDQVVQVLNEARR